MVDFLQSGLCSLIYMFHPHLLYLALLSYLNLLFVFLFSSLVFAAAVVVLAFAICWAPFHIDRLLWSFITNWTDHMYNIFEYVHILSGVLFYLSSAINPIIYNLLSSRFREQFFELMCRHPEVNTSQNISPPYSKRISFPKSHKAVRTNSQGHSSYPNGPQPSVILGTGWEQELDTTFM